MRQYTDNMVTVTYTELYSVDIVSIQYKSPLSHSVAHDVLLFNNWRS